MTVTLCNATCNRLFISANNVRLYSKPFNHDVIGEQGWRSGESARLPPMCPGFDSRTRRHMWVEFVVGSLLCSERFFSGYSGFPLSSKTNTSKFQFDLETVDEEPSDINAHINAHCRPLECSLKAS